MEAVFPIGKVYVFSPNSPIPDSVMAKDRESVRQYIEIRLKKGLFPEPDQQYRFYMLPDEGVVNLPHRPRLERNIAGHCYFTLGELRRGTKVVTPASRMDSVAGASATPLAPSAPKPSWSANPTEPVATIELPSEQAPGASQRIEFALVNPADRSGRLGKVKLVLEIVGVAVGVIGGILTLVWKIFF